MDTKDTMNVCMYMRARTRPHAHARTQEIMNELPPA
jgi:hypothetical protein